MDLRFFFVVPDETSTEKCGQHVCTVHTFRASSGPDVPGS